LVDSFLKSRVFRKAERFQSIGFSGVLAGDFPDGEVSRLVVSQARVQALKNQKSNIKNQNVK
jgi:hypothetical protein